MLLRDWHQKHQVILYDSKVLQHHRLKMQTTSDWKKRALMENLFDVLNRLPTHTSNHQARVLHPHTHCQSSPTEYWRCCSDNHIISSFVSPLVLFTVLLHLTGYRNQCADTHEYISTNTVSNTLWLSDHNSAHHTEGTKYN